MPTLLHPGDHAFHRMVAAFEGEPGPWLAVNRALRDATVSYAVKRCAYYREVWTGRFEDLPILTKDVIRARRDDLMAEGIHRDRRAADRTSGSLGPPVTFVRDTAQGDIENVSALRFLRWMQRIPPDATRVWMTSAPPAQAPRRRGWRRRDRAPDVHPIPLRTLTPARLREEASTWTRFPSYFLYGHASTLLWIADQVESGDLHLAKPPVSVVTTADTLTEHGARRLKRVMGVAVSSWYGSREMNGFVAGTLPGSRRYVFNPLLVHLEILDDEGQPAEPGEAGRVVLTDLNNLVMPFLRYDTGDLAVGSAEGATGGFPLVDQLIGRAIEVLRLPSRRTLNSTTLGRVLFSAEGADETVAAYQCAMTGENEVELRVVWARPPGVEVRMAVQRALEDSLDPDTTVRLRDIRRLGVLPSGKAWLIRDETGG